MQDILGFEAIGPDAESMSGTLLDHDPTVRQAEQIVRDSRDSFKGSVKDSIKTGKGGVTAYEEQGIDTPQQVYDTEFWKIAEDLITVAKNVEKLRTDGQRRSVEEGFYPSKDNYGLAA